MKITLFTGLIFSIAIIATSAQNAELKGTLIQGFEDVGAIKIKAEQGDATAQVKLANAYLSRNQSTDAAKWYEAAAKQNSVEGEYQLGNLLLWGRFGVPKEQSIVAKPTEGLGWNYMAATNGYREAWRNMAKALQNGTGCSTNLVEAYAWQSLLADNGDIVGRVEMNNLALKLSSEEITRGKSMEDGMKKGNWPQLDLSQPTASLAPLVLQGISGPENNRLAIINNTILAESDETAFKVNGQIVKIKCLKVTNDGALIRVEGENEPRWLRQN